MAKHTPDEGDDYYAVLRTQVTGRLTQLALEQERLKGVLALLPGQENGKPASPLVPDAVPEVIPTPKRRTWSPEAREAQRKRMKAFHRKQKATKTT